MGVQDLIFGVVNMLHMLSSSGLTLQGMCAGVKMETNVHAPQENQKVYE